MSLNISQIKARDIPEAWAKLMGKILDCGYYQRTPRGAFTGSHKIELDLTIVEITQPWREPLLPITPPGIPAETDRGAFGEFMVGSLTCTHFPKEGYEYYGFFVEPQLLYTIEALSDRAIWDSNHFCIICGDGRTLTHQIDPWIWKLLDFKVKEGRLNGIAYFRSLEAYGAFPRFAAVCQKAKEMVVQATPLKDGPLYIIAKGAHLYDYSWEPAKVMAMRDKTKPAVVDGLVLEDYGEWQEDKYQDPMVAIVKGECGE